MTGENLKLLIDKQDLNGICEYLSSGGDINAHVCDINPLIYALSCDFQREKMFLLRKYQSCDYRNNFSYRDDEIILYLIKAGADMHARDYLGHTPLMHALNLQRGYKVVEELINAGSDITAKSSFNGTPLMYAVKCNYNKTLIEQFLQMGANVHDKASNSCTPLFYAVNHINSFEIVSLLMKYGPDVNLRIKNDLNILGTINCRSCSESEYVCESQRMIDLILKGGLMLENQDGGSVIHSTNCNYIISLYLKKGVYIDSRDSNGNTPLMKSVYCNDVRKVKSLLFLFNANPNCVDYLSRTVFHFTSRGMFADEINVWLLYHGGNLCARDVSNQTALDHMLERSDRPESVLPAESLMAVIKHVILYIDENRLNDSFRNYHHKKKKKRLRSFVRDCKRELYKIKNTFVKDNLTFYEFCLLKKFYKSVVVDVSVEEYFFNFTQIKNLFPIYNDMIIMRMKDNQTERYKRVLKNRLENIIIRPLKLLENETDSDVHLIFDCTCLLAKYLNKKAVYSLFLASFEH